MSRHARENPELYEDPEYSRRDELIEQAHRARTERKDWCPDCSNTGFGTDNYRCQTCGGGKNGK